MLQVIRLYQDEDWVEVEWLVGPVPVDDGEGREVVARYTAGIDNGDVFYTDSNGRQLLQRRLDYRPTFDINQTEPVAQVR